MAVFVPQRTHTTPVGKKHRRSTVRVAREDADDSTTPLCESYIIPARPA
jgi:hypothetical protein